MKIKKKFKVLFLIIIVSIGAYFTYKYIEQKKYEQTYEYKLQVKGYSLDNTKDLINKYEDSELEYILNNEVSTIYLDLVTNEYFKYSNFYKYIEYLNNNKDISTRDGIEIINTHRDSEYYENTSKSDITKSNLILVNKYNYLDSDYVPDNLVPVSLTHAWGDENSVMLQEDVYDAYKLLWNDAKDNGYKFMILSGYRSYDSQEKVFNDYKNSIGEEKTLTLAAKPGFSEHQTGLAIDMYEVGSNSKNFHLKDSYNWLLDNAYKYGFILRYPEESENITGYSFESWHYRYVGTEVASYIYEHKITYDEYYELFVS